MLLGQLRISCRGFGWESEGGGGDLGEQARRQDLAETGRWVGRREGVVRAGAHTCWKA